MFEQLLAMVQEQAQQSVVANPDVPNAQNEAVMHEAASTIQNGMQQMAAQGGPGAIKQLFEGVQQGNGEHPAVQQLSNRFAGNIMDKFGIPASSATAIATSLIPMVLGKLMNRAKDPADKGFSLTDILGSVMGNHGASGTPADGGGLMDTISSMGTKFGLDKNGDGKTDLQDLMKMFGH